MSVEIEGSAETTAHDEAILRDWHKFFESLTDLGTDDDTDTEDEKA